MSHRSDRSDRSEEARASISAEKGRRSTARRQYATQSVDGGLSHCAKWPVAGGGREAAKPGGFPSAARFFILLSSVNVYLRDLRDQ